MEPAHPPLPSAWNLPFHLSAVGNQTSTLILESEEGFSTATTGKSPPELLPVLLLVPRDLLLARLQERRRLLRLLAGQGPGTVNLFSQVQKM